MQPWKCISPEGTPSSFIPFITRHYLFYRALLLLLIRRLSVISLPVSELRTIIDLILDTYSPAILKVLARCDKTLTDMQRITSVAYDAILLEGMNVSLSYITSL